jgi:hypothetical protein
MTIAAIKASGTIRVHPENADQMISSWLSTMQEEFEKLLQKSQSHGH